MLNRNYIYLLFLVVLTGILYTPIMPEFFMLLMDDNNSHGILVPFISFFLIWKKYSFFKEEPITYANTGLLLLVFSLLFYFISIIGGIGFLSRLSLVVTVISLIYYNYGKNVVRHIWFPLLFLFFMIPVPISVIGYVSLPLQMLATRMAAAGLTAFGIPVFREGNMLYFANASLEVAEACSGIRSLISYLMLGSLFAYLMQSSISRKLLLVAMTIPFAFLANLLRVTGTGLLAHYYGNKVAQGFLHEFSGMVTFLLGLVMVMSTYRLLGRDKFFTCKGRR